MAEIPFPKLKYQLIEEHPGFRYIKVLDPDEEEALGGGWFDTPTAAREAESAPGKNGDTGPKTPVPDENEKAAGHPRKGPAPR